MMVGSHGCSDQACDVKFLLANSEPSTQGAKPTCHERSSIDANDRSPRSGRRIMREVAGDGEAQDFWNIP
jgi:hypothetical protein